MQSLVVKWKWIRNANYMDVTRKKKGKVNKTSAKKKAKQHEKSTKNPFASLLQFARSKKLQQITQKYI